MPAGTHTFAVSRENGTPTEYGGVTLPTGHSRLEADIRDRSGARAAGLLVVGLAGVAGVGLPFLVLQDEDCADDGTHCIKNPSAGGYLLGIGAFVGGLALGFSLAATPDAVTIVVSPMSANDAPARARRMGDATTDSQASRLSIDGLKISSVF